ncbi:MAG: hypothetical protein RR758_09120 [Burkholderiaceae bacterium]
MATATTFDFPKEIWLGKVRHQWPLVAFGDEASARRWAAEDYIDRGVIGPIAVPGHLPVSRAKSIPARAEWLEAD